MIEKILVTAGSGYIGSHTVLELLLTYSPGKQCHKVDEISIKLK